MKPILTGHLNGVQFEVGIKFSYDRVWLLQGTANYYKETHGHWTITNINTVELLWLLSGNADSCGK